MDTSQILTREDRITTARESCMVQLGRKYKNSVIDQEKHEKKYRYKAGERTLHKRSLVYSFGIRLILGMLFFLLIFWIREHQISYQGINYEIIREHILDNQMIEKAEECVQPYFGDMSHWSAQFPVFHED